MIEIKNMKFGYRRNHLLFSDLNLSLSPGRVYGLLGKNGAGKTTLLKIISGLLFPKKGECKVFGNDCSLRLPSVLNDIYLIPEEFELPSVTINNYVKADSVFYKNFSVADMDKYLYEFGLSRDNKLNSLSYGQKKKFLIAFGLSTNAKILIMDEPTNGLDIPSKVQFRKIIASSITDERCFIISTHQVRDLESILDTIIILEKGKIIFNYAVEKIAAGLSFKFAHNEETARKAMYSEDILGGKMLILQNENHDEETKIELEILFNGVLNSPEMFNKLLNK